ncbi:MAG: heme-binding protein [Thermodesulfobacteriota bacterium]|nr:heme-binding protein [Thermodesulfobacteriota bacterium]
MKKVKKVNKELLSRETVFEEDGCIKKITLGMAEKMIDAALRWARNGGFECSVAVLDASGTVIAVHRDNLMPETLEIAIDKAYTAAAMTAPTRMMAIMTSPMTAMGVGPDGHGTSLGFRHKLRWCTVNGGIPIRQAGTSMGMKVIGAIGTSGCPSGTDDNLCSQAGATSLYE